MNGKERFAITLKLVLLIALVETFSMACLKKGTYHQNDKKYLFVSMIGYLLIVNILYVSFKYEGMGHVNLIWNICTIISGFLAGYLLFDEKINHYTIYACLLAFLAIYFCHKASEIED